MAVCECGGSLECLKCNPINGHIKAWFVWTPEDGNWHLIGAFREIPMWAINAGYLVMPRYL